MKKSIIVMALVALMVLPYFTYAQEAYPSQLDSNVIEWPAIYHPSKSSFYVHNEIDIAATPEIVWTILTDVLKWESWYIGCKNVSLLDASQTKLQPNSIISWKTMDLKFKSHIQAYTPSKLLAWESRRKNIQGYHVWLIIKTPKGCKVITDESQNGWLTFFEKLFQPRKLKRLHDVWLIELKKKAESVLTTK